MTTLEEAAANWRTWFNRGEFDEGAARVDEALNAPGASAPSVDRVRVLYGAHLFAFRRNEPSGAYAQACLDLARELGDVRGESDGLTGLAREALRAGDYRARPGLDAMGDALTELNQAGGALARGQRDEAARRFAAGKRQIDALGAALDPDDQFEFDWLVAQLAVTSPT